MRSLSDLSLPVSVHRQLRKGKILHGYTCGWISTTTVFSNNFKMSISQLLAAAEWLERRERGLNNLGGPIIPLVLSKLWIIVQRLENRI